MSLENDLEKYASSYKIFIESSLVLDLNVSKFCEKITPLLQKYKNKIIIPYKDVEQLNLTNKFNLIMGDISSKVLIEIKGDHADPPTNELYKIVFSQNKDKHKILFITQNYSLGKEINKINSSADTDHKIVILKINKNGLLEEFDFSNIFKRSYNKLKKSFSSTSNSEKEIVKVVDAFKLVTKVTKIKDTEKLRVSYYPKENDTIVTDSKRIIRLGKEIAAGGEGIVYHIDGKYVAKIYKQDKVTKLRYEKLKKMVSKKIDCDGICYPTELIYNDKNEFVGYVMPKAAGYEIGKSIFLSQKIFERKFPNWKKKEVVETIVTILKKMKYLHDRNIIMGDINQANILVVSPKEVYFVDTDSYQIEEFPCPVGMLNFVAPEIQGKKFSERLRTIGNENFAIATLLFMLMLPGKAPYSQQGSENAKDSIIKMEFPYPIDEKGGKKIPRGAWGYIWSNLPFEIKEKFYRTFMKGEKYSTEKTRLSVKDWLLVFEEYLNQLKSGALRKIDPNMEEIYPKQYNKEDKVMKKLDPNNQAVQANVAPTSSYNNRNINNGWGGFYSTVQSFLNNNNYGNQNNNNFFSNNNNITNQSNNLVGNQNNNQQLNNKNNNSQIDPQLQKEVRNILKNVSMLLGKTRW